MCTNGKYSLYSHGSVVTAQRADAGVSVRVIRCRPGEGGRQSPLQPQRGTERLFCSRHYRVEVGTHAATRSQTLARCHHCFLHRARERRREGKQAWWSQQLSGALSLTYSFSPREIEGRRGCFFWVWGLNWEKTSGYNSSGQFFFKDVSSINLRYFFMQQSSILRSLAQLAKCQLSKNLVIVIDYRTFFGDTIWYLS